MEDLEKLSQNKELMTYILGTGLDVGAGNPLGANTGAAIMQNITAQNYNKRQNQLMQWIKEALNPGTKSSMSVGSDGVNMKLSSESDMFKSLLQDTGPGGIFEGMAPPFGTPGTEANPMKQRGAATANPFEVGQPSPPEFSASDLAGLTPEDMSRALGGALSVEGMKTKQDELEQKRISDVIDMLYKNKLMENISSEIRAREQEKVDPLDQIFPINALHEPEGTTLREWNALTPDQQNYEGYFHTAKQLGDKDIMTLQEFKQSFTENEQEHFLNTLMNNPKMKALKKELLATGAPKISIGERLKEEVAKSELEGQKYFNNPKSTEDFNKYMSSSEVRDIISSVPGKTGSPEYKTNVADATAGEIVKFWRDKIIAGSGTIQSAKLTSSGKIMVWTVKWKDGTTSEVRRVIRP